MPLSINFSALANKVKSNTLILTPNARTQKAIVAGYVSSLKEGEVVYAPRIKSFSQWIDEIWDELSFFKDLPSLVGNLELKAWLKNTISTEERWHLTNQLGVAEKVLEAYQSLTQWGLSLNQIEQTESVENSYFVKWISLLEEFLFSQSIIPAFAQIQWLVNHWKKESLEGGQSSISRLVPQHLLLVGFDQLTPLESEFLELCKKKESDKNNSQIEEFYPVRTVKSTARIELDNFQQEVEFAANLAIKLTAENPESSIGVVFHQLSSHLQVVHQTFNHLFQPEESKPWIATQKVNYNVSAGQALADLPMIAVALKLITLNSSGFDLQTLLMLKTSPFINWGENDEIIRRFLHQQSLLGYSHYSAERLIASIDKHPQQSEMILLRDRISALHLRENRAKPMSAWVDLWNSSLRNWGWLFERNLDESEQKQLLEFNSTLSSTLKLNLLYPVCSLVQSREFLQQALRQSVFQLPSDRTNVHVLGVLEATGLEFDELILVGFSRENWPQKAKLNPFLPIAFQQQHNMRGSSAEREYAYAHGITKSLLNSSTRLWVTQTQAEDVKEIAGSPFFDFIALQAVDKLLELNKPYSVAADYSWITDEKISIEEEAINGGAYLLSYYASCPFKALTTFQLKVQAPQQAQKGIEPSVRGAWLHLAMELLWNQLKSQANLLGLSNEALTELVRGMVADAQKEFESQLFANASLPIISLEFEKLVKQILDWLTLEKQRPNFSVLTEVEKSLTVGPLTLKLRIDRIDQDDSGRLEIIDYKTGISNVKKWLGTRPDEAQMPAYVLACGSDNVASLSYAQIKTGNIQRSGVNFDKTNPLKLHWFETNLQKTKDTSRYLMSDDSLIDQTKPIAEQWKQNLQNLAINIASGVMPASPKNKIESCRYCDFSDLCRISEQQLNFTSNLNSIAHLNDDDLNCREAN